MSVEIVIDLVHICLYMAMAYWITLTAVDGFNGRPPKPRG
jgi:hypothetical protein